MQIPISKIKSLLLKELKIDMFKQIQHIFRDICITTLIYKTFQVGKKNLEDKITYQLIFL